MWEAQRRHLSTRGPPPRRLSATVTHDILRFRTNLGAVSIPRTGNVPCLGDRASTEHGCPFHCQIKLREKDDFLNLSGEFGWSHTLCRQSGLLLKNINYIRGEHYSGVSWNTTDRPVGLHTYTESLRLQKLICKARSNCAWLRSSHELPWPTTCTYTIHYIRIIYHYTGCFINPSGISEVCSSGAKSHTGDESMSVKRLHIQVLNLPYKCSICPPLVTRQTSIL
jgi:hypothetical protein